MTLQEKMFSEMADKTIFNKAKEYAYSYADSALDRNVFPLEKAISNLVHFDEIMPEDKTDPDSIIEQLHNFGSPATVSQIGGRYFGLVNGGVIPVSLATKWLTDFWDQNTPLYITSPITSKLETVVESWLKKLFGLPSNVVAGFVSGTSMAIFCGLAAGRYKIFSKNNWDINKNGLNDAPKIRIVAGKSTHGTVLKAVALLGLGIDNIEWVNVDKQGRIIPELIPQLDENTILILQAGNVNSGAFDDFETIIKKANKANSWVHIDGAFGLWASGTKRLEHLTKGFEKANSWSVDAHKTLNAPYDSGILLCSDKDALVNALQANGSYIIYSEQRDGMLFTPEMSRRARVIELWATLKYLGMNGVDELVFGLHERAVQFAKELKEKGFDIKNDVVFNQVLVACETEEITNNTITNIQESLECWVGGAVWKNESVIRISVCSWATTKEDITRSVNAFVLARKKSHEDVK
jgi:glutamate/tyrosine decarboxylase-like PLP-dependent enzyme